MGTTTKNLGLYKPAANDYYNVETDQNENFDKIDEKFGEVDNGLNKKLNKGSYEGDADDLKREIDGKEPAFEKNSGFNKEKTSEYKSGKDAEKLFTQEGANDLYKEVETKVSKDGDTISGNINFDGENTTGVVYKKVPTRSRARGILYEDGAGNADFGIGVYSDGGNNKRIYVGYGKTPWNNGIKLDKDGNAEYPAKNLNTDTKEVVGAINQLHKNTTNFFKSKISGSDFYRILQVDSEVSFVGAMLRMCVTGTGAGVVINETFMIQIVRFGVNIISLGNTYMSDNSSEIELKVDTASDSQLSYICIKSHNGQALNDIYVAYEILSYGVTTTRVGTYDSPMISNDTPSGYTTYNFTTISKAIIANMPFAYLDGGKKEVATFGNGTRLNRMFGIGNIIYIQDSGTKQARYGYIDKVTNQLYYCIETTQDTVVNEKFILATNISLASRLYDANKKVDSIEAGVITPGGGRLTNNEVRTYNFKKKFTKPPVVVLGSTEGIIGDTGDGEGASVINVTTTTFNVSFGWHSTDGNRKLYYIAIPESK